ncbi:flagellar basal body-associated FliL family protein [Polymorphobacter sp. PAMC 29334]|uniref:flagellar basal body-associated FliL family protein n=1 Tax=Polymorphobacter sp. PAMC 29334 TaxID=2862331 RepID=UPI001C67619D|nr:flagellar basal body-associated FliL family protein [Polymorphobacter sp. PAMC 29334]QYE34428.1 flagellar basal body-associated FliL family protein [Polymorphobacter sp. PAMC 29334]
MADTIPKQAKSRKGLGSIVMVAFAFLGAAVGSGSALVGVAALRPGLLLGRAAAAPPVLQAATPIEYIEIDNAFTSNLADTGRYLQLRIAVSNTGGPQVTAALAQHKLAIVSAVLAVLGEVGEADVADRAAKTKLRSTIRTAINDVLSRNAHVGGVDEVFFTTLVVQ